MNRFVLYHTYMNLVDDDKARPIVCPDDQQELVSMIDTKNTDNEDPVFWCPVCQSRYDLGINTWDQIEAIVMEHYDL